MLARGLGRRQAFERTFDTLRKDGCKRRVGVRQRRVERGIVVGELGHRRPERERAAEDLLMQRDARGSHVLEAHRAREQRLPRQCSHSERDLGERALIGVAREGALAERHAVAQHEPAIAAVQAGALAVAPIALSGHGPIERDPHAGARHHQEEARVVLTGVADVARQREPEVVVAAERERAL